MATITIGGNDYGSFESVADATEYLGGDISRGAAWDALDPDTQGRALVSATRLLLRQSWCGTVPDIDTPPQVVADATAIMAADLATKPKLADGSPTGSNIKRAKAGSAEVEYFRPTSGEAPISQAAWDMLVAAGYLGCVAAGDPNDGPFVSNGFGHCAAPGAGFDHPPYWNRCDPYGSYNPYDPAWC
jgi:hypothetical protein